MKLIPRVHGRMRNQQLFTVIANDPDMQKASPRDPMSAASGSMTAFTAINAEDIEFTSMAADWY